MTVAQRGFPVGIHWLESGERGRDYGTDLG